MVEQKTREQRLRLEEMLISLRSNKSMKSEDIIDIANGSTISEHADLVNIWEDNARKCFSWMFDTIIPINPDSSSAVPDFMIHIKEFSKNVVSVLVRGMEIPIRITGTDGESSAFRKSNSFKNSNGVMMVFKMAQNITLGEYKERFFSELERIENLLETD
ncbi:MAG TPA: hypothetical protein VFI61_00795 [Patescibacteria group bacterium]|nr:hypothetical protein [Patescibacteria group bacterium]